MAREALLEKRFSELSERYAERIPSWEVTNETLHWAKDRLRASDFFASRPVEVGCKSVEIKPFLGDLDWAEGAMALPDGGCVSVKLRKHPDGSVNAEIEAPEWVSVKYSPQ